MYQSNSVCETLIIVGTYEREDVALASIASLIDATSAFDVRIILSDASSKPILDRIDRRNDIAEYIWTPGFTSMATSRNLAYSLSMDKYCYEWIMFLEDDLSYSENWYPELISFASRAHGCLSPLGLAYGTFSASPDAVKQDDTSEFDKHFDCNAGLFGLRADQRLFKASLYSNFARFWDSDILGISSCQTGKQIHRLTMNGFCAGSIGHRNLCRFIDGEDSTWAGQRDIGPAAFDKRLSGYNSIVNQSRKTSTPKICPSFQGPQSFPWTSPPADEVYPKLAENIDRPMTAQVPFEPLSLRTLIRRIKKAFRLLFSGSV